MALFSDGPPAQIGDLTQLDSQLVTVANVEGIDVNGKLCVAYEAVGIELCELLDRMHPAQGWPWVTVQSSITTVVVTTPLLLWHAYRTLESVYADAYDSQLNDRYAGKEQRFHEQAQDAKDKLIETGVGVVGLPVAKAMTPVVVASAGALADATYYVTMSWVNSQGEQGASAAVASFATVSSSLQVQPGTEPANATGWNVFVGLSPSTMVIQNGELLAPSAVWAQPNLLLTSGQMPGNGQKPDSTRPLPRVLLRG